MRPGAAITRGSQCVNLTIAAASAVGSPVTVPITLIADDSFPAPTAAESGVDGGTPSEAGVASEAGAGVDSETADSPISIPVIADAGGAVTVAVDASLDCDALTHPPADAGLGPLDGGVLIAPAKKDGGCGCSLGAPTAAAGPLAFALLGLALLVRRRRSANS